MKVRTLPENSKRPGSRRSAMSGSITVYLILSLVLVMAVICALAESARVCCINAKLQSITFMAADSCFSEFAGEVFDEYGIMGLWKNEAELKTAFDGYVQGNISMTDAETAKGLDLYKMRLEKSSVMDVVRLAEYALPGTDKLSSHTADALGKGFGVIMSHHGMAAVGGDLDTAFENCVKLEENGKTFLENI